MKFCITLVRCNQICIWRNVFRMEWLGINMHVLLWEWKWLCGSCLVCFAVGFLGWTWSRLFGVPISVTGAIGLTWEGIDEPAVLFSNGGYPIRGTCKFLELRVVKISAAELDSRTLPSRCLAYQRSNELGILRRRNPCSKIGASSRGETHNGENSQADICVSCPVERNYQGYKRLRVANNTAFVFCTW